MTKRTQKDPGGPRSNQKDPNWSNSFRTLKLFNLVQTFSVGTNETFIATILTTFEFAEFDISTDVI